MIFGSNVQNKVLKNASNIKVDTSQRTKTSNKMAAKIATNKTSNSSGSVANKSSVEVVPRSSLNNGNPDPIRGSFEGLMSAPSTVLQPDGVGYANKAIQRARYQTRQKFEGLNKIGKKFESFKKYDNINRYGSNVAKNSSASKLNAKLSVEKMFR